MWNIGLFHTFDARSAWSLPERRLQVSKLKLASPRYDLYPPVRKIPHPAAYTERVRFPGGEPSKSDTLHSPGDQPPDAANLRLAHVVVGSRVGARAARRRLTRA